jgi:hypothetical protein
MTWSLPDTAFDHLSVIPVTLTRSTLPMAIFIALHSALSIAASIALFSAGSITLSESRVELNQYTCAIMGSTGDLELKSA